MEERLHQIALGIGPNDLERKEARPGYAGHPGLVRRCPFCLRLAGLGERLTKDHEHHLQTLHNVGAMSLGRCQTFFH